VPTIKIKHLQESLLSAFLVFATILGIFHMSPKVLYSFYYQNFDRNYFVTLDDQVFVNLPNFGVGKIF
jgi:hypothetical protein